MSCSAAQFIYRIASSKARLRLAGQINWQWLTGSWILTPKGGEHGRTRCDDFAAPAINRLNQNTAKIVTFQPNGQYRDLFAYTTPSGDEHYTKSSATWRTVSNGVQLNSLAMRDAFEKRSDTPTFVKAKVIGPNVMLMGDAPADRFVRCVGTTHKIHGE